MADHDSYSDAHLRSVLREVKSIAVVGASSNPNRPSSFVTKYLAQKGYRVVPINPGHAGREIAGAVAQASLADLHQPVDMVDVFRRVEALPGVAEEIRAMTMPPSVVWFQLGIRDDEIAARLEAEGMTVIQNRCPKIEYARLCGEIAWTGFNRRTISAKKPILAKGYQSFTLGDKR
jgi:predicted CoA-binding protein